MASANMGMCLKTPRISCLPLLAKNWAWWAFLITGMVTVFIYAKLWRRSNVMTDLEFYELRYSGKPAAALRAFKAGYFALLYNFVVKLTSPEEEAG